MPIATPEVYAEMLDRAKETAFAYPAINCTSSETSTPRCEASPTPAATASSSSPPAAPNSAPGSGVKDMVTGAVALAEFAHVVAAKYPINVALHTDHCPKDKLDTYVRPLLAISQSAWPPARTRCSSRTCGTARRCRSTRTCEIAQELLKDGRGRQDHPGDRDRRRRRRGGRRRGRDQRQALHDARATSSRPPRRWAPASTASYLLAATFGNVHGVYKPGNVKLRPDILEGSESGVGRRWAYRGSKPFDLVFHGGSGSEKSEIQEALPYGVVKMNVDTDTQYAFTRPIAGPHVHQLRRRAQGRRRGRRQEGVRPAQLPQGRRSGDGRSG